MSRKKNLVKAEESVKSKEEVSSNEDRKGRNLFVRPFVWLWESVKDKKQRENEETEKTGTTTRISTKTLGDIKNGIEQINHQISEIKSNQTETIRQLELEKKNREKEYQELQRSLEVSKKKTEKKTEEYLELQEKLRTINKDKSDAEKEKLRLNKQISILETEKAEKTSRIEELKRDSEERENEIIQLRNNISEFQSQITSLKQTNSNLIEDKNAIRVKNNQLEEQFKKIDTIISLHRQLRDCFNEKREMEKPSLIGVLMGLTNLSLLQMIMAVMKDDGNLYQASLENLKEINRTTNLKFPIDSYLESLLKNEALAIESEPLGANYGTLIRQLIVYTNRESIQIKISPIFIEVDNKVQKLVITF